MPSTKSVAFHTLGCKLNYSETSTLSRMLENEGFEKKDFDDIADVYVINTCSVTDNADKECRHLVRRIQRRSPESLVVVTGCYAQLKPREIADIPGVDLVLGAAEKFNIAAHLKELSKGDATKICSCDIEEVDYAAGALQDALAEHDGVYGILADPTLITRLEAQAGRTAQRRQCQRRDCAPRS